METLNQLCFSVEEYRNRVTRTQQAMAEHSLDGLVCHNLANICYLTGFRTIGSYGYGHYAAIIPAEGEPTLFSSDFESHNGRLHGWLTDIATYEVMSGVNCNPIGALADLLVERGYADKRIGYEAGHHSLTVAEFQQLRSLLPKAELVQSTSLLEPVKMIKSAQEIGIMRKAALLTSAGFRAATLAIRDGARDNDAASAAYKAIIDGGGEYFSLQPIVTVGKRSGVPHSTFHRIPIRQGDVVFVELSACLERYSAPAMRAISVGRPSKAVDRAYAACVASVESILETMKGGAHAAEIAQEAGRRLISIEPNLLWHGCYAYSVGITFPPACSDCPVGGIITEEADMILQPGMVFHCNTSLRSIGRFGVAVGETVLVTRSGCEVLTDIPRELAVW